MRVLVRVCVLRVAKVRDHREMETRVKTLRTETRDLVKEFNKTEDDLKALQVCVCVCLFFFVFRGLGYFNDRLVDCCVGRYNSANKKYGYVSRSRVVFVPWN